MELLLIALTVLLITAIALFVMARHAPTDLLPPDQVLRNAEAMHLYDHDDQAIFLLQEYIHHYPDNPSLREKLIQLEAGNRLRRTRRSPDQAGGGIRHG